MPRRQIVSDHFFFFFFGFSMGDLGIVPANPYGNTPAYCVVCPGDFTAPGEGAICSCPANTGAHCGPQSRIMFWYVSFHFSLMRLFFINFFHFLLNLESFLFIVTQVMDVILLLVLVLLLVVNANLVTLLGSLMVKDLVIFATHNRTQSRHVQVMMENLSIGKSQNISLPLLLDTDFFFLLFILCITSVDGYTLDPNNKCQPRK